MITSAKNYTKKTQKPTTKKRTDRPLGQMVKASYTDKIAQRSIPIRLTKSEKGKKNLYIK